MTGVRRGLRLLTAAAVLAGAAAWWSAGWRDGGPPASWPQHQLVDAAPDGGFAYRAALPAGAPDRATGDQAGVVYEDGRPLAGDADHETIRKRGVGHWSFWHGTLWFASSDGSDPRQNGRRYTAAWPDRTRMAAAAAAQAAAWVLVPLTAVAWLLLPMLRAGDRGRARRRLLAKCALVPGSLLVLFALSELVLRLRYPFADNEWPGRFDPACGFALQPGGTVRFTNLFDFCVEQQANSLGFLDREVPLARPPGTRRILFLGDSCVEAVQVPMAAKAHVLLEGLLRARGLQVDTVAIGTSGCGTANELGFYEAYGRRFHPDLVVVPVFLNDLANNSPLLEAVRNGWHPDHLPRLFFAAGPDGAVRRQPIDPEWELHVFDRTAPPPPGPLASWLRWSRTCRWLENGLAFARQEAAMSWRATAGTRMQWLREHTPHAAAFAGWHLPDDLDPDEMTATVDPPPVCREAVQLSAHALAALRDAVAADGGRLLLVAAQHLGAPVPTGSTGRRSLPRGWLDHWEPLCRDAGVPLLDLRPEFERRGVLATCTFRRDNHWNETGHATAAAVLADWLVAHPELLGAGR